MVSLMLHHPEGAELLLRSSSGAGLLAASSCRASNEFPGLDHQFIKVVKKTTQKIEHDSYDSFVLQGQFVTQSLQINTPH